MIEKMKVLLRQQSSCVLATTDGEKPHCSLMAYIISEAGDRVFLVTPRNTRKYRNILNHPQVSLLIDTRGDQARAQTKALTVAGTCCVLEDIEEITTVKEAFRREHPHLQGLLSKEDVAFLSVAFDAFLFLDGPERAHHETLDRKT
jgi:uncharacterized pyridoxamine 5'-phosphate oxidase family protein